jgi:2-haloacid dehalogenase
MQKCMAQIRGWGIDRFPDGPQALGMSRRDFLRLIPSAGAAGLLGACAPTLARPRPTGPLPRSKLRAICFDLFTLFDPRSVVDVARRVVGEQAGELCESWRTRQFEYSWLRAASQQYVDFRVVTEQALSYAAKARGLTLDAAARSSLVDAYSRLTPWPDARASLVAWQRAGLLLAPLSNYSPPMLRELLDNAGLSQLFAQQISTDSVRTFKPDPRAYALGESRLGLKREEIAFAAFGGWDAAGAKWYGFPTFWVNRLGVTQEELVEPDGTGPTLAQLGEFVAAW